ncbi:MAG: hypothetical protein EOP60_07250 [Sphingomonadales bacterium]|nr:MAG: hypothetical protein EOP60_07250 [Sphingomonadales bacterium]
MASNLSRRQALLGTTALLATPIIGSSMTHAQNAATIQASPLLAPWPGGYGGTPPWDQFVPAMFPPAFEAAMVERRAEFQAVRDNPAAPTFANTIAAMETQGRTMDRVQAAWGVYTSNLATREVQAINREWSPRLTKFYDELGLDPKMFARIETIHANRKKDKLDAQQMRLTERTYRSYVRRGAKLSDAQRAEVSRLNQALSVQFAEFSKRVLADEETWIVLDSAWLRRLTSARWASDNLAPRRT